MNTKIIALANHKGGVSKTTSVINLGASLNQLKRKILMIDLDPQSNLTQSLGVINTDFNVYGALRGNYSLKPIEVLKGYDVIPSTVDLSGAEVELSSEPGREYILKELLEPLKSKYDYIIIDCPPSLGLLTINAFTAADEILIPLQAEFLAMQGVAKLLDVIEKIKKRLNQKLKIGGIFITQYDSRKILNKEVASAIEAHSKELVFKAKIRNSIALAEAPAEGLDIFRYNPKSHGAEDYMALCKEILKKG